MSAINKLRDTTNERYREMEERRIISSLDERQRYAREEFAQWREANPDFSSKELIDNWKRIRIAWGISEPPKPKKPRRPARESAA